MLLLTTLTAAWCALVFAAPLCRSYGWEQTGTLLYAFFHRVCHQIDGRSFHVAENPLAVCHRCTAIYGSFLLMTLSYPWIKGLRTLQVPDRRWLLLLLPMAVDAVLNDAGLHASTLASRLVTGALAGGILPWFIIPSFIEAVQQLSNRTFSVGELSHARKTQ